MMIVLTNSVMPHPPVPRILPSFIVNSFSCSHYMALSTIMKETYSLASESLNAFLRRTLHKIVSTGKIKNTRSPAKQQPHTEANHEPVFSSWYLVQEDALETHEQV